MFANRHQARILAMQMLYSDEFRLRATEIEDSNKADVLLDGCDNVVASYALCLYAGVKENLEVIDSKIKEYSQKRSIPEIDIVDLSILRIAIYSLLFDKKLHPNIVIDESVKLSLEFSTEISYRFINGILDAFVKAEIKV